jgi:hypothetical protein
MLRGLLIAQILQPKNDERLAIRAEPRFSAHRNMIA